MDKPVDKIKRKYTRRNANPSLAKRAEWLLRRGFDVPPSKQKDYSMLQRAGYKMIEIKEMLELE